MVTLTHQLDTGVRLENESDNEDYNEDTARTVAQIPRKAQPTPQAPRNATPTKAPVEIPKTSVNQPTIAQLKGNDILQKIASGQFKPIAVFNPQEIAASGKDIGIIDNQNGIKRYGSHKKDVDLTLRIPGQYIENAVVAVVISVADAFDNSQVVYQNILNNRS